MVSRNYCWSIYVCIFLTPSSFNITPSCRCSSLDTLVEWAHVSPAPLWQHQATLTPSLTWCKHVPRTPSDGHPTASPLFCHTILRSLHEKLWLTFSLDLHCFRLGLICFLPFCSNFWYLKTFLTFQSSLEHRFPDWFASLLSALPQVQFSHLN